MKQVLVGCDGATIPAGSLEESGPLLRSLNHRGPEANVNLRIQSPSSTLLTNVEDRAADQSVSRGGEADVHGDDMGMIGNASLPCTCRSATWSSGTGKQSSAR